MAGRSSDSGRGIRVRVGHQEMLAEQTVSLAEHVYSLVLTKATICEVYLAK